MADYWLVRTSGDPVEGPYTAAQLKQMAADGVITGASMIHGGDQWFPATSVKGLFSEESPAAPPSAGSAGAPASPPGDEPDAYALEPPALAPTSSSPTPGAAPAASGASDSGPLFGGVQPPPVTPVPGGGYDATPGPPGTPRNLTWFVVFAAVALAFGLVVNIVSFVEAADAPQSLDTIEDLEDLAAIFMQDTPVANVLGCFQLLFWIGLFVSWLVWVYTTHRELQEYTRGAHPISPGLALGLSFVPVFNWFWKIHIGYRMAQTIERIDVSRRSTVSPGTVLTLLILSVIPGCCLGGLGWLFTAIASLQIQKGLNELWARDGAPGAATLG